MHKVFKKGDTKTHQFKVRTKDFASFDEEEVHKLCSTFALAREIEWSSRLFVKDMLEADEEGIGTRLEIEHVSPAFVHDTVEIIATFDSINDGEILCAYEAHVDSRIVAVGKTGQKILPKAKLKALFNKLK